MRVQFGNSPARKRCFQRPESISRLIITDHVGAGVPPVQSGCTVGILNRVAIAAVGYVLLISALPILAGQSDSPMIARISPTSGPEGSRIEITGRNLQNASALLFANTISVFKVQSPPDHLIVLVPHKVSTATITVIAPRGRATSPFAFVVTNDPTYSR